MKVSLDGHYSIRRLLKTGSPVIVMMLVTSIYTIVDGFFVSNCTGTTAFAGMTMIWPFISIIAAVGLMFGTGGSALVSKIMGEGDDRRANEVFTMIVRLCLIVGIIFMLLLFIFMPQIVSVLGAQGALADTAILYGRITTLAMPAFVLHLAWESFFMAAEKPQLGTFVSVICGVMNVGLDALFILVFGWGLGGAAIATAISLCVGGFYPLYYFSSRHNNSRLHITAKKKIDWKAMFQSCTNGLSEFVGSIALNIVSIFYNIQLLRYVGENGVSAYGVIMYVGFIFAAIFIGYNLCVSQLISYNYGAGNKAELRSLLHKSLKIIAIVGVVLVSLALLSAPALARAFFGYDSQLCELSIRSMRIYMLCFLLCGFNMFTSAWFTALNNGVISALVAFARTLVFELLAVFILPFFFGVDGIWMSVNIAEVLAIALSTSMILAFRKRYLG